MAVEYVLLETSGRVLLEDGTSGLLLETSFVEPRPVRINTSQGWVDIANATGFVSGIGAPTAAVGATGAMYLDTASGRMYGPKAAGAWPAAVFGRVLIPGNTYNDVKAAYANYAALLAG
jgi:hypothetical protein